MALRSEGRPVPQCVQPTAAGPLPEPESTGSKAHTLHKQAMGGLKSEDK